MRYSGTASSLAMAAALLIASCTTDPPSAPETEVAHGALAADHPLQGQPADRCHHIEPVVAPGAPLAVHTLDFGGHPDLLAALEDAGAFDDHGPYEEVFVLDDEEVTGFGVPAGGPVPIAGVDLLTGSLATHEHVGGNGALRMRLIHLFWQDDGDDAFVTVDRAVCAPAGPDPATCEIKTDLLVVDGEGAFENAAGRLRNRGTTDLVAGTLDIKLGGRICGDGLGG